MHLAKIRHDILVVDGHHEELIRPVLVKVCIRDIGSTLVFGHFFHGTEALQNYVFRVALQVQPRREDWTSDA